MNEIRQLRLPPYTYLELAAHARAVGHGAPEEVAAKIISAWLADQRRLAGSPAHDSGRGYQWKCLFLPEGTLLRCTRGLGGGGIDHACVEGDLIVYGGAPLSPRQLAVALAGPGRNAWRELMLRFPGEACWQSAFSLRQAHLRALAQGTPSPVEVMMDASAAMAEVLRNALALLEQVKPSPPAMAERRRGRARRVADMADED